ncbi:MAG: serine--tRNA ligase, partial [Chthoniobacteraceae bacterium]|nr:serine--tRNA ligase [Chthoniobacteraceae bacterium]
MLDIRLIRENPDYVRERLATRGGDASSKIDDILACDRRRRELETRLQQLNSDRKRLSKEIGMKRAKKEPSEELEAQVRGIGEEIARLNDQTAQADQAQRDLLLQLPNLPHDKNPIGVDAKDNPEVRQWGQKPAFAFAPADHMELAAKLHLFHPDRAAKI